MHTNNIEKAKSAFKSIDIFKIFSVFLFCAFVGWVFETTVVWVKTGVFPARGYWFVFNPLPRYFPFLANVPILRKIPLMLGMPIIEMYGFGGMIMIFGFQKLAHRPVVLFFTGMGVLTLFELLGSYFCTEVLHKTFWDYSDRLINFQGRICLSSAIAWGALSVLAVKVLAPWVNKLYLHTHKRRHFKVVVSILVAGAIICALCKYWWFANILA